MPNSFLCPFIKTAKFLSPLRFMSVGGCEIL